MRIFIRGIYQATNHDLRIKARDGQYMNGTHHVIVVKESKDGQRVKVKTISSLENSNHTFHNYHLENVKKGKIIPIPSKDLNSDLLSGIFTKGIWIRKNKLFKASKPFKYPKRYSSLIEK